MNVRNMDALVSVRIIYDKNSGRSRGFGFVHFTSDYEAKCAKDAMDGKVRRVWWVLLVNQVHLKTCSIPTKTMNKCNYKLKIISILQALLGRPLRISFAMEKVRGAPVVVPRISVFGDSNS